MDYVNFLSEYGEAMLADGFEDCIIGVGSRCGTGYLAVYSVRKILDELMSEGSSEEEAIEHFEFNIIGAWVGDGTPIFLHDHLVE